MVKKKSILNLFFTKLKKWLVDLKNIKSSASSSPQEEKQFAWWSVSEQDILKKLQADPKKGLSEEEAKQRLKKFGENTLKVKKKSGVFKLLLSQFNTPFIYLLSFAATLSLILYEKIDALIIFGIIIVSGLLSFFQEKSALKAMEKLLAIVRIKTEVLRNKSKKEIPIEHIVPGDILELNAGDVIPGDCYLLNSQNLNIDESSLTGESFYAEKSPGPIPKDTPVAKRTNSLFMGTHVVSGTATALVVSTGKNTEFGKISKKLEYKPPETDFENGLRHFGYFLLELTLILLVIIFAFNVYYERRVIDSLMFALALAVGLTPQLLPAIISINLAHGASKMAKKSVIVKRLASIENFGSMNILCSDKTGTLTTGKTQLDKLCNAEGEETEKVALYAYLNSHYQSGYTNPIDKEITQKAKQSTTGWSKLGEIPYDFERKKISILAENKKTHFMITKGAFPQIFEICTHAEQSSGKVVKMNEMSKEINKLHEEYCKNGYRVIAIAYKDFKNKTDLKIEDEKEMIFLGFLLFFDPPKKNIAKTVNNLKNSGIDLKIITGDNELVALHLASILGLSEENILTGTKLNKMNDRTLYHRLPSIAIFAEIEPNQKERIILALRKAGNVVGYLGDGINDVTGLHAADVSITVDSAADAAKEVADIVLLKKDLSVLQDGVSAGRMTFVNTLKYIFMATSANFGNMFSMAGASLFLNFIPLLPKQVLLTNLMTDFPEMTIATDNVDNELVDKPLRWNIHFIRKFMILFGLISSIFDYATFGILLWMKAPQSLFQTGWFVESVVSATFIVLIVRTFKPFYRSYPSKYLLGTVILIILATFALPFAPFASYLGFTPLPFKFYLLIVLIVFFYMLTVEIAKKIFLRRWMKEVFS